ncbi:uncharacterized protein [Nicotiana sylvestris]|uniref:uncharacterized protein n=1 Tax=Nicotiana sylvestris TaxID=4096 RepID=UPI00388CE1C2
MDKSWITKPRNTTEYLIGLNQFLDFAFANAVVGDRIKCPCPKCGFAKWQTRDVAFDHLVCKPFHQNYVTWSIHGERNILPNSINIEVIQDTLPSENPVELLINEAFGGLRHDGVDVGPSQVAGGEERLNNEPASNDKDFFELLRDGSQELYEESKYSKLEFLLKLYHIKCLSEISDKGMSMALDLLRDAFTFARIPNSSYKAKKTIRKKKTKKPAKILRYFPLKPRLQRLFMCSKITKYMRWHAEDNNKDGIMRHPRNGEAWKRFDTTFPEFTFDPRNVRLGLASDGFNSFVIIPGPCTVGNNIDVYLQPHIKELNELQSEGVETFDS